MAALLAATLSASVDMDPSPSWPGIRRAARPTLTLTLIDQEFASIAELGQRHGVRQVGM
jgi:hypothetical protein